MSRIRVEKHFQFCTLKNLDENFPEKPDACERYRQNVMRGFFDCVQSGPDVG